MTMSSFLMNSTPYAEPKFPPNEEYSQNNYMPSQSPEDYYRSPVQNYGYNPEQRRYGHEQYTSSNVNVSYGCVSSTNTGMTVGSTGVGTAPDSSVTVTSTGQHNYRTPPPPAHSDSPGSVPSPTPANPNTSASPPGCTAPANTNTTSGNPPVIYPWMKRVHVGTQGKGKFLTPTFFCLLCPLLTPFLLRTTSNTIGA